MSSLKLSVYNLHLKGGISWNDVVSAMIETNSDISHCIINEQSDIYIGGYYLFETLQNQTQYNVDRNCFETVQIKRQNLIKFDLYIEKCVMFLWGSKRAASLFITLLEQSAQANIIIDLKQMVFKEMINKLLKNPSAKFIRMKILNVVIDNGIVANCNVNLSQLDRPSDIIKKYLDSISQISLSLGAEENPVSILIYSSGSVVIYRNRDEISDEIMNDINYMIGGEYNG